MGGLFFGHRHDSLRTAGVRRFVSGEFFRRRKWSLKMLDALNGNLPECRGGPSSRWAVSGVSIRVGVRWFWRC
jgi:hypothetical protein